MPKHNFKVGDLVTYIDHTNNNTYDKSDISFISNEYIVVCIHRELKTPEEAAHAVSKWREVKILVYKYHYDQLIPLNSNVNLKESPIPSSQTRRHD